MNEGLVNSCFECKAICCKHGTGPYRKLPPREYLENFSTPDAYNTQCMALSDDGKCTIWGTPDFPHECRTHVCNQRVFTQKELSEILEVEDRECPNCECEWTRTRHENGSFVINCEICGFKQEWKPKVTKRGKKII